MDIIRAGVLISNIRAAFARAAPSTRAIRQLFEPYDTVPGEIVRSAFVIMEQRAAARFHVAVLDVPVLPCPNLPDPQTTFDPLHDGHGPGLDIAVKNTLGRGLVLGLPDAVGKLGIV
ncbi:MAG: hypothetical protein NXH94_13340 [Rhodobacteraceae bacterium]|jgi:hypothetical protein|nr:hypothetical protein [Paracoccaceae bacterium]PWL36428.1 MAG: hypothetical protein DCO97_04295 [Marivita sp. XM-24bin2]